MNTIASGHAITTMSHGKLLDAWFPTPTLAPLNPEVPSELLALVGNDDARDVSREIASLEIDLSVPPTSALDVYLRLHLLSHRLVKPHGVTLDGIFGLLNNVVWTSAGHAPLRVLN